MRYPAAHKDATRSRIVSVAARRFRRDGPHGTAIGDIMTDLRLTHGGFYRHFRGKDDLFAEALAHAIREASLRIERAALAVTAGARTAAIIDSYLSPGHAGDRSGGCPIAALSSDLGRQWASLRRSAFEAALREHLVRMSAYMPGPTAEARVRTAGVLFSGMAGTLTMSRTIADAAERARMLAHARQIYKASVGA
jgi:TetR/AcrR family transcriptional repressor of nem operon